MRHLCLTLLSLLVFSGQGFLLMAAVEEPTRLRPPLEVHGWKVASVKGLEVSPKTIFDYMDGAGELYLAYTFRRLRVWTYGGNEDTTITVEAFEMGSPEDAFGLLSQDPEGEDVKVGQRSAYILGFLQFWQGRWYFRILSDSETPESRRAVLALGQAFAAQVPGGGREPQILARLPSKGLVAKSVRYFHTQMCLNMVYFFAIENLLQLGRQTDAVMADYRFGSQSAKFLLIQYPQLSDAAKARTTFFKGYLPEITVSPDPIQIAQIENGEWVGVRLDEKFLALAFKSRSRDVCERLLKAANLKHGGKQR